MPGEEAHFYTPRVSIGATTWYVATSPPEKRRVTINDVARKAGVNKGTVSRALRGMDGVGAETRARILAAAEELEYSASELGMALVNRKLAEVETLFLPADPVLEHISSSIVKDVARHGGDVTGMVPDGVVPMLDEALNHERGE